MIIKKITIAFSICIILSIPGAINAQRVGISTDGSVPDVSALLDVKSITHGLLIPRMSSIQRAAIASPAQGLLVYDNVTNSFWFYKGLAWTELTSTTNYWSANGSNIFNNSSGNVGIGTNTPAAPLHIKKDGEAVRIEGALPSIGFYNNSGVYKGFVWQGPGDNISLATAVGNSAGRVELYNNGILNMSVANLGVMEVSGNFPQIKLKQNGLVSGTLNADGFDAELSAYKSANSDDIRGNLLLQLDVSGDFGNQYAGNVGIKTDNPVNILQIGNTPGFSGNQLAIGNGAKGMSFFQNSTTSHWYSSANFALMGTGGDAGRVGIGTVTPSEKLEIASGNVKIGSGSLLLDNGNLQINNGKILTPPTGSFSMIPICYGYINANGTIHTATPNVSVTRTGEGVYHIYCAGIKASSILMATVTASVMSISAAFVNTGEMEVITRDLYLLQRDEFLLHDNSFYFVIYN